MNRFLLARHRLITLGIALIAVVALLILAAIGLSPMHTSVELTRGSASISLSTDHRWVVWPLDCANVAWNVEHIKQIYLNNRGITGHGSTTLCGIATVPPSFKLIFVDESFAIYNLGLGIIPASVPLFLILIAIEMLVMEYYLSASGKSKTIALYAIFIIPLVFAIGTRIVLALSERGTLDWDETYYMNIATMGASGHGLYPYINGLPPMRIMGGIGYVVYIYVLGVRLFGPSVLVLRAISLLWSFTGLVGIWLLARMWYGSGTAWMSLVLAPTLYLFNTSNNIRMDSATVAYVSWSMLAASYAFRKEQLRWHLLAGLIFGLGLEVHLDTAITAGACGIAYLFNYMGDIIKARRLIYLRHPAVSFVLGYLIAAGLFYFVNIMPDLEAFYRVTAMMRVHVTSWYSQGTSSVMASLLSPDILIAKETIRFQTLLKAVSIPELLLGFVGAIMLIWRHNFSDKIALILIISVIVLAAVITIAPALHYYIHILPVLMIPLGPLLTHGTSRQQMVDFPNILPNSIFAFIVVIAAISAPNIGGSLQRAIYTIQNPQDTPELISQVRSLAAPDCKVIGPGGFYVQYFSDYPYYVSLRWDEIRNGMVFRGLTNEASYWALMTPDLVFAGSPLPTALQTYLEQNHYQQVNHEIWLKPGGCQGGP